MGKYSLSLLCNSWFLCLDRDRIERERIESEKEQMQQKAKKLKELREKLEKERAEKEVHSRDLCCAYFDRTSFFCSAKGLSNCGSCFCKFFSSLHPRLVACSHLNDSRQRDFHLERGL